MATTKPDYTYKWASDGDKIAPSEAKIQAGWGPEIPPYQWENFIQNRQDEMLAYLNERGIPEWDNRTNYIAGKSYVQGSDGKVYKSVTASGPTTIVQDPVTDSTDTYWTIAFADVGAFLDQTAGDARYTQRSNNLSDLTNVATARTNLGLGTAATKNAQTSPTDTSVGALMAVGAGGWLGTAGADSYIAGFPQSIEGNKSQIYRREMPDNGVTPYSASIHFATVDTWGRLRISYNDPKAWIQGGFTANGSGWTVELYHTGNISSFAQTLLDDADAAAARGTLDVYSKAEANGIAIGVGQTWQNVTASRASGTTYTNTTGKPIMVSVYSNVFNNSKAQLSAYVDGLNIQVSINHTTYTGVASVCFIVPAASTYSVTSAYTSIAMWAELR